MQVMVLSGGLITEFESPQTLLQRPESHFAQVIKASHLKDSAAAVVAGAKPASSASPSASAAGKA